MHIWISRRDSGELAPLPFVRFLHMDVISSRPICPQHDNVVSEAKEETCLWTITRENEWRRLGYNRHSSKAESCGSKVMMKQRASDVFHVYYSLQRRTYALGEMKYNGLDQ